MIESTEAIVLRSMKYGETSRIVTLYTRRYGRISVLAKGARSLRSKFGSSLEPMSHAAVVIYRKEQRTLHLLSKSDIARPMNRITGDAVKMAAGLAVIELVAMVMREEEENQGLFDLLASCLHALDDANRNEVNIVAYFLVGLLRNLGFGLSVTTCARCARRMDDDKAGTTAHLLLSSGSVICQACAAKEHTGGVPVPLGTIRSVIRLTEGDAASATNLSIAPGRRDEILAILQTFLQYHVEGTRTLRSLSLLHEMESEEGRNPARQLPRTGGRVSAIRSKNPTGDTTA